MSVAKPNSKRNVTVRPAQGYEYDGPAIRLPRAKTGECEKKGCKALPAFEGAEFCEAHGVEYCQGLKGE